MPVGEDTIRKSVCMGENQPGTAGNQNNNQVCFTQMRCKPSESNKKHQDYMGNVKD